MLKNILFLLFASAAGMSNAFAMEDPADQNWKTPPTVRSGTTTDSEDKQSGFSISLNGRWNARDFPTDLRKNIFSLAGEDLETFKNLLLVSHEFFNFCMDHNPPYVFSIDVKGLAPDKASSFLPKANKLKITRANEVAGDPPVDYNLDHQLVDLTRLTYLDVGGNYWGEIPEWINRLTGLTYLNLARNDISDTPVIDFSMLPNLTVLDLSKNSFTEPLDQLSVLNLKKLFLRGCPLKERSSFLRGLSCLQTLDLRSTHLTPADIENISDLTQLEDLNLQNNLDLGNARIQGLSRLSSLTRLNLEYTSLSSVLPLLTCTRLTSLNLARNPNLTGEWTAVINSLPELTELDLRWVPLHTHLHNLSNPRIETLNLNSTWLKDADIKDAIKGCPNISSLGIGFDNNITESGVSALSALTRLTLLDMRPLYASIIYVLPFRNVQGSYNSLPDIGIVE